MQKEEGQEKPSKYLEREIAAVLAAQVATRSTGRKDCKMASTCCGCFLISVINVLRRAWK
jgi:hypothetical protein